MHKNPADQTILCEQSLGDSGKEELPFNRKRTPEELGSVRGSHLLQGGEKGNKDEHGETTNNGLAS